MELRRRRAAVSEGREESKESRRGLSAFKAESPSEADAHYLLLPAHLLTCSPFTARRQKLRKAEDAETRKKLVQERSATMPKDDAGRKKLALQSREGYLKMYQAYCAQP